jgi:hypothetical protein
VRASHAPVLFNAFSPWACGPVGVRDCARRNRHAYRCESTARAAHERGCHPTPNLATDARPTETWSRTATVSSASSRVSPRAAAEAAIVALSLRCQPRRTAVRPHRRTANSDNRARRHLVGEHHRGVRAHSRISRCIRSTGSEGTVVDEQRSARSSHLTIAGVGSGWAVRLAHVMIAVTLASAVRCPQWTTAGAAVPLLP